MDYRWKAVTRDSKREVKVILHPTAAMEEIRRGIDPGSDDSIDLSEFVTQASHSAFDASVTLSFNRELFGPSQPKPYQILEIQLKTPGKKGVWQTLWMGVIDSINSFTLQRGTRSMQLSAKTRDSQDIWRNAKRVTPLYPQLTDFVYIAQRVARTCGMKHDEIILPPSAYTTAHSNTQLADMNGWDMITTIFLPLGWTPFIDGLGRLRAANRQLQGRTPEVKLTDDRIVKVGGQRQRPPVSRVRVAWLNPLLKKNMQMGQKVTEYYATLGWWWPWYKNTFYFSDDQTKRAENTYVVSNPSVNKLIPFCRDGKDSYKQQAPNQGRQFFLNYQFIAMATLITMLETTSIFGAVNVVWQGIFVFLMMCVGTGKYEIWGNPYDYVHARNISEAFDSSVPTWVDTSQEIESDFITNEEHAKLVAIRELIYNARSASKWNVTIVDDPRIEYGDIVEFHDGSQMFVEDFSRNLERGSEATLDIKGFLLGPNKGLGSGSGGKIVGIGPPDIPGGGGGIGTGGGDGGTGGGGTTHLIWGWADRGGPPPDAPGDQPGAPTSMGEWDAYFYSIIHRTKGTAADDYQAVFNDLRSQGMKVNPSAGEVPDPSWPFFGLAMQVNSAGEPRGRLYLPTATPDGSNYYTHVVDVLADAPGEEGGSGGPSSGPGSRGDPIIPMSNNAATCEDQIKRSLYHYGRKDYSYWGPLIHCPEPWQGGDGRWYIGWDRYMEVRMAPGDTGSAGHDLLPQEAIYQDPVPIDYPVGGWK